MPTYEYVCDKCGAEFERFQSITAEPVKECPDCSGPVHRKIGGGAAFIMKRGAQSTPCGRGDSACGGAGACEKFGCMH